MTKKENLLLVAMEECSELQQAISKAMRFGMDRIVPETDCTNEHHIMVEYQQLQAVMNMLKTRGIICDLSDYDREAAASLKIDRVQHCEQVSEELGCIKD